ncbi:Spermidine synthase [Candidatus Syntrophocurvum alkaliphilum]|uniref:Polyamine aminopropyltransferase n=1 Tax=Candidatus Syntrophocurvum alkaliphilum TaxID=2293317 RepID=A0A6I6DD49_9FIRM|nr:polyamine aminopropyltransferase [Candidatus Syntrophocurvum alkaliphilum]QGT99030.1 Spermidine synthase [Candidatus Syntrophocurvum alkaliphilum]
MDLWVTEYQTPSLGFSCKISETLRVEQTKYQHLAVVNTDQFGKMLLLDGMIQTTEVDEFVYHEMITMVAINSHPNPKNVLIIGGGDGGTLREVVHHPLVENGTLVEIDDRVIQASKDFFPQLSLSFNNPKANVIVDDGIKFVKQHKDKFDVVIIDSTEPVGPAIQLFSKEFYTDVYNCLKADGIIIAQSESPFFNKDVIKMAYSGINNVFNTTKLYLASIPTYPSGLWSFTIGSKKHDPEKVVFSGDLDLKYYTSAIHQAAFMLPNFVKNIIT